MRSGNQWASECGQEVDTKRQEDGGGRDKDRESVPSRRNRRKGREAWGTQGDQDVIPVKLKYRVERES